MIDRQTIEYIREKSDIVEVISEYVALRKRGKNYIGLCPFHSEKTPSFTVSPDKNIFHCFGCGEGGEVFAFIQKIENISFVEAVNHLGQKYGIEIKDLREEKPGSAPGQDRYYRIMDLAAKFFAQMLLSSRLGSAARSYVENRGITQETIHTLGLGFAPGPDPLFQNLISRGIEALDIEKVGLVLKREKDSKYFDRFQARLIFPIRDLRGRTIAFGGRTLGADEPKYINSPDSVIYSKGNHLYGLDLSREEIKKSGFLILVEGYLDFLTPYQAGIKNIAASLGTALTQAQTKLISRFTKKVVLAYDADSAGSAAAERGAQILRQSGIEVRVARLSGKDPDETIKIDGVSALVKATQQALPWFRFKIEQIMVRCDLSRPEGRAAAMHEGGRFLAFEKDRLLRTEYAREIGLQYNLDPQMLMAEAARLDFYGPVQSANGRPQSRFTEKPADKILLAEKNVIRLALEDAECFEVLKEGQGEVEFVDPRYRQILEVILCDSQGYSKNLATRILQAIEDEVLKKTFSEMMLFEEETVNKKQTMLDSLNVIKAYHLKQKMHALKSAIREAEQNKELTKIDSLYKEFSDCSNSVRNIEGLRY